MKKLFLFASIAAVFSACSTESLEPIGATDKNNITLEFENRIAAQSLILNDTKYTNTSGEDFTITTLNYFISNVAFKKTDGTVVKMPDQYFLVRQADKTSLMPVIKDVPAADYTEMTFTIGVDSVKSISAVDQRTGVLDIASYGTDNMYWSWNSGYIFFKMEGISSVAPTNAAGMKKYQYHVGGFGGRTAVTANNLRTVTLSLPAVAAVRKSKSPTIHLIADISKVFSGVSPLKIANGAVVMSPAAAGPIANNYAKVFTVDHIH
ncbi:MAG: hypothetical protein RIR57_152 [Bacteroidota bacterium]|jgi:hypothetical protein